MKTTFLAVIALLGTFAFCSAQDKKPAIPKPGIPLPTETPSAKGAAAYIISPANGATVKGPVTIKFGLKGMGVCPAGLYLENTGHHHLLVDMDAGKLDAKAPIPTIEGKCLHYGKGQTEVTLDLPKGKHTLQLAFANFAHMFHKPAVTSKKITITVE